MKKVILISILFFQGLITYAQPDQIYLETTELDALYLIENGNKKQIYASRKDSTQYKFKTSSLDHLIQPICSKCKEGLTIKIFSEKENKYSKWIKLASGETISLENGLNKTEKWDLLSIFKNLKAAIKDFVDSSRIGRINPKGQVVRGENDPKPGTPKLNFRESNGAPYFETTELEFQFTFFKKYPVSTIFILDEEANPVFWAGDIKYGEQFGINFKDKEIPSIQQTLQLIEEDKDEITYQMEWSNLSDFLWQAFKKDTNYQIGILLEKDDYKENPYLLNFNLISF